MTIKLRPTLLHPPPLSNPLRTRLRMECLPCGGLTDGRVGAQPNMLPQAGVVCVCVSQTGRRCTPHTRSLCGRKKQLAWAWLDDVFHATCLTAELPAETESCCTATCWSRRKQYKQPETHWPSCHFLLPATELDHHVAPAPAFTF